MFAQDLAFGIAVDKSPAVVPGHHVSVRVEHEYRIIPDRLYHQPVAFLAFEQIELLFLLFINIA
ncbi:hypothetical protein D3C87_1831400 [compost metagenome]